MQYVNVIDILHNLMLDEVQRYPALLSYLQNIVDSDGRMGFYLLTGCYPPLYDRKVPLSAWFAAYVNAYVERDIRQLLKIQELETFHRFVRLCAGAVRATPQPLSAGHRVRNHSQHGESLDLGAQGKLSGFSASPAPRQLQQTAGQDAQALFLRCRPALVAIGDQNGRANGNPPTARQHFRNVRCLRIHQGTAELRAPGGCLFLARQQRQRN
jgi:hypothetical protein